MLTHYPIGSTAYLREPERNGDRCGVIVSKGGGYDSAAFGKRKTGKLFLQ